MTVVSPLVRDLVHGGVVLGPCDNQTVVEGHVTAHDRGGLGYLGGSGSKTRGAHSPLPLTVPVSSNVVPMGPLHRASWAQSLSAQDP